MRWCRQTGWLVVALLAAGRAAAAQTSTYHLTFPDSQPRWMQVELTLADVPPEPLVLQMSAASPGRYGLHDFVGNVSALEIASSTGQILVATRPTPTEWRIEQPPSSVRVIYRVAGARVDGTYLAIDAQHAHVNMPAALLWARGFEDGTMTVRFEPPAGRDWRIATQLFRGADDQTFTAPNLQYLMDSPAELGPFALRTFTVGDGAERAGFRLAVHHRGSEADVDALAADTERIVRETRAVFGEFPRFDSGSYTFIADYLPGAVSDGMEHRNSTVLTSSSSLREARQSAISAVAHEFFHAWNVERIRPRSLEPFDLTRPNQSGELWLAEGFTEYYGPLILARSGLSGVRQLAADLGALVAGVLASPARRVRTLEEMSRLAVDVDSITAPIPPNVNEVYLSYYTWGGAVGLALDLTLRDRSGDRVTLDDFMRLLWERHGRAEGREPGLVARPYIVDDVKDALAAVSGDRAFADEFFRRYIQGHDVADYDRLLRRVGFLLNPGERRRDGRSDRRGVIVPIEEAGGTLTPAQQRARSAWITSRVPVP